MGREQAKQFRADAAARFLRRRRAFRRIVLLAACLVATSVIAGYGGAFGRTGDDWNRFNHREFIVTDVLPDDTLRVRAAHGSLEQMVALAGIDVPDRDRSAETAQNYLSDRLLGKTVILALDSCQTRDAAGRLLAYIFPYDGDNLNADMVRAGLAFIANQPAGLLSSQIEVAAHTGGKKPRRLASAK